MAYRKTDKPLLSIYVTAGYPDFKTSTLIIQTLLDNEEVDMIEIGMPFSDPIADGPVIQASNQTALENGMTMQQYFRLCSSLNNNHSIPLLFMGYWNNVLKYGVRNFLSSCRESGIDSTILPDLPVQYYADRYFKLFTNYELGINCLVAPQSTDRTINEADAFSHRFIYQVSASSTTGTQHGKSTDQWLARLHDMALSRPRLVGFGISSHGDYLRAGTYADGVIIGSAFIRHIAETSCQPAEVNAFIQSIRYDHSN